MTVDYYERDQALRSQPSIKPSSVTALKCAVSYSRIALETVSAVLMSHYNIGEVRSCQFWYHGLSDIYRIETLDNRYIFRISHHHWRSRSDIQFELEFLTFLRHHQLPVASPLPTAIGELCIEMAAPEGERYGTLFEYAEGSVPIGDLDCTQSNRLGETVAKLHRASYHFSPLSQRSALTTDLIIDDSLALIIPFLEQRPRDIETLRAIAQHTKEQLQNLPQTAPFWTVCWGDPHSGNAHFTHNNQLTLFDFDQCGYSWRAFDIAKFRQVSMQAGCSPKIRQAFLHGYQNITALSALERDCLPALTTAAYLWAWGIHLNRTIYFEYSRLDERYFTRRLEHLQQLHADNGQFF